MAHQAREVLRAYKEHQGIEQPFAFLQAPLIVHRLFLKKPERIEAVGVGVWRALLLWRLVERALRVQGETTGSTWTGWDKQETQKPTAVMMMIKFAAVTVLKGGDQRQRAPPLATVQQPYLQALRVSAHSFTAPQRRERDLAGTSRSS